jgi:hypothetical protein
VPGEGGRDGLRVLAVALHPDRQGLQAAQDEPAVERAGDGPERLLEEAEPVGDGRVVRRDEAADHVGVTAEVFRRGVEDEVGAQLEGLLEIRRGEGVVHDDYRPDGVCGLGRLADVDQVQEGVRRRLQPDDPGRLVEVVREAGRDLVGREVREAVALRLVDLREHAVHAAVDVVHGDDALPGAHEVHDRRRGSQAGGVRKPVLGVLERRQTGLERGPGRVAGP